VEVIAPYDLDRHRLANRMTAQRSLDLWIGMHQLAIDRDDPIPRSRPASASWLPGRGGTRSTSPSLGSISGWPQYPRIVSMLFRVHPQAPMPQVGQTQRHVRPRGRRVPTGR
jgi:hypothetical protein